MFEFFVAIKLHIVVNRFMMSRNLLCAPKFWINKLPLSTLKTEAVYFLETSVHPHKTTTRSCIPEAHNMNFKK
jgi:hypothetical protein